MKTIQWLENKNPEWKVATITFEGATFTDVSINKKDKDGREFPNFDTLKAGDSIEGELWQSKKGTWYLFPPKVATTRSFTPKKPISESVAVAQENKARQIAMAQDRSAWMWSKYSACELVNSRYNRGEVDLDNVLTEISDLATKIYNMEPIEPFN